MPFIYNVKFICGIARSKEFIVSPGLYTTEINILNFDNERTAKISKLFIPVVLEDRAIAREPKTQRPLAKELLNLPPNAATMDDCVKITKMLKAAAGGALKIGFLKIESSLELTVTAVYTVMDSTSRSVNIDVDQVQGIRT